MTALTYSAEVTLVEPYARASTRLASRAITWIAGAFDLAFSAASTLHPNISQRRGLVIIRGVYLRQQRFDVWLGQRQCLVEARDEVRSSHTELLDRSELCVPCSGGLSGGKRRGRLRHDVTAASS
jgi:hypothetical protein